MRIAKRLGIVLGITALSIVGDLFYIDATRVAGQSFDFYFIVTVRSTILVAFYLLTSIFILGLLLHNERNLFFSFSLLLVGLFMIWISSFPDIPLPFRNLFGNAWEITTSSLALTIHSGAFLTAVGLLRLLPAKFFPLTVKK